MMHFFFEDKDFLANRLRKLRMIFGFKQEDIAKVLNISRSTYSYYELGVTRPDPATLGKLAYYYDVPVTIFYDEYVSDKASEILLLNDTKKRSPRHSGIDLSKVGELKPVERELILFVRSNGMFSAKDILESLEYRVNLEKKKAKNKNSEA